MSLLFMLFANPVSMSTVRFSSQASSVAPWFVPLDDSLNPMHALSLEVGQFLAYVRPTAELVALRVQLLHEVSRILLEVWPSIFVTVIGSQASGLLLLTRYPLPRFLSEHWLIVQTAISTSPFRISPVRRSHRARSMHWWTNLQSTIRRQNT